MPTAAVLISSTASRPAGPTISTFGRTAASWSASSAAGLVGLRGTVTAPALSVARYATAKNHVFARDERDPIAGSDAEAHQAPS